jgi:CRISPR-associated protein Cas2
MLVVVVYDVSDDKRRAKIGNILKNYGSRVQKSVFECDLEPREFEKLRERLKKVVKEDDGMRYYSLCGTCLQRVVVESGSPVTQAQLWFVV